MTHTCSCHESCSCLRLRLLGTGTSQKLDLTSVPHCSLTAISAASPSPQWSTTRPSKLASGSTSVSKTEALGGRAEHLASSIVVCVANVQQVDVCAPAALALEPAFSGVTSKGISMTFEWPGELATKFLPELTGLGLQFALSMVKFYHQPFLHFIFGKTIAGTEETSNGLLWWLPSRSRTWQESRSLSNTDAFSVRRISTAPLLKTPGSGADISWRLARPKPDFAVNIESFRWTGQSIGHACYQPP